jgi:hypothetical protein
MDEQEIPVPTAFTTPDGVQRVTAEEYLTVRRAYDQCRQDYADLRREMREGLRDQFAAAALTGLLGAYWPVGTITATEAYKAADAMLAARERKEG